MLNVRDTIHSMNLPGNARAIFVDGKFAAETSTLDGWDAGVTLRPMRDGNLVLIHVGAKSCEAGGGTLHVAIPENRHVRILECWIGQTGPSTQRRVTLGPSSSLEWVTWQNGVSWYSGRLDVALEEGANFDWFGIQSRCEKINALVSVMLQGPNAQACLYGLSFGQGSSLVEQEIEVQHLHPHTRSRQMFKSVLRDQAKNVFAGRVIIARDAQKSDASQKHHSLCFHSTAEAVTKPELEILADDVKAAHGATVGRLDEEQLFYLETRGISRREATEILARAFVQDILNHVGSKDFYSYLDQRLGAEIPDFVAALGTEL